MAFNRTPPLDERIKALRADIDAFIDARVEEETKRCPGVPAVTLRICLTHGIRCLCSAYLDVKKQDDEAAALVKAETAA